MMFVSTRNARRIWILIYCYIIYTQVRAKIPSYFQQTLTTAARTFAPRSSGIASEVLAAFDVADAGASTDEVLAANESKLFTVESGKLARLARLVGLEDLSSDGLHLTLGAGATLIEILFIDQSDSRTKYS